MGSDDLPMQLERAENEHTSMILGLGWYKQGPPPVAKNKDARDRTRISETPNKNEDGRLATGDPNGYQKITFSTDYIKYAIVPVGGIYLP